MKALKNDAKVLEIGSGSSPWPRSDVLVDRFYIDDSGQRGGTEIYRDRRPLIIASGEFLPFIDNAFDFVYCSHVIEHAEDIIAFLNEISRVGRAGYLECPNPVLECILDQSQHNWYITKTHNKLLIHPKTLNNNIKVLFSRFYLHIMRDHFLIGNYFDMFTVRLEWQNSIEYEMCPEVEGVLVDAISEDQLIERINKDKCSVLFLSLYSAVKERYRNKLLAWLKRYYWGQKLRQVKHSVLVKRRMHSSNVRISMTELEKMLCCPKCKGHLVKSINKYECKECILDFPIQTGIPVFL